MTLDDELLAAIRAHDSERVLALLKAGANPNAIDPRVNRQGLAIGIAWGIEHWAAVVHLIDFGALADTQDRGAWIREWACENGDLDL